MPITIERTESDIDYEKSKVVIPEGLLQESERLSIVIVSSEISPYSKTGGLADVADNPTMFIVSFAKEVSYQ